MTSPAERATPRIALTGARGVLGRSLQAELRAEWSTFTGDLRDAAQVRAWLDDAGDVSAIIHLAAVVPTVVVDADPVRAFATNVAGTLHLLEAVRARGGELPWIFLASSSHVYRSSDAPLREDAPTSPVSLYGTTKLQGEEWGRAYAERFGLRVCVGRIFSFTSPLQPQSYFVPGMFRRISEAPRDGVLAIPGLHGTRDFLSTSAIAQTIDALRARAAVGIFNVASGRPIRLLDVAHTVRRLLGRDDVGIDAPPDGTAHLVADVGKLRALGIAPDVDVEALLESMAAPTG